MGMKIEWGQSMDGDLTGTGNALGTGMGTGDTAEPVGMEGQSRDRGHCGVPSWQGQGSWWGPQKEATRCIWPLGDEGM